MHVCPKSYASHATLQALLERWGGLDIRSASGKRLKVWGMREVAYDAQDLSGKFFSVRIPFVVCEVRKPSLSLACWRAEVSMLLSEVAVGFLVDMAGRCASEEKEIRIMLMSSSNADCWKERERK